MAHDQGQAPDESWRGSIGALTPEELSAFLAPGRICRLACLRDDGWPYVVPVWYEWDGQGFYVIPRKRSAWARFIQRDPRVSLCIDEEVPPSRKVLVQGHGRILEEPNVGGAWVEIGRRMAVRYLGEHGPDYLEPTLNQPRWLIRVEPLKLTTWQGVAWHPRYLEPETPPPSTR
jgi:PPOX class probable F420-dependent enzyme